MSIAVNSNTNTANVSSSLTSKMETSKAEEMQDRFLKLLVAQLDNQDPMNPMDNAQMTSQMAQINTVAGINQLNQTLQSATSQMLSMQILQGASMVGHDVLLPGNNMSLGDDGIAKGSFDLAGNADRVSVVVTTPSGQTLDTLELGSLSEGRQNFSWDASGYAGQNLNFAVVATSGKEFVSAIPMSRARIMSVSNENGTMNLQLQNGRNVAYDSVKAIY